MILTDKQAQLMLITLNDTRVFNNGPFTLSQEARLELLNQILTQQDETPKNLIYDK